MNCVLETDVVDRLPLCRAWNFRAEQTYLLACRQPPEVLLVLKSKLDRGAQLAGGSGAELCRVGVPAKRIRRN